MRPREHWESVYRESGPAELSWHQDEPALSLAMIVRADLPEGARVIDVGGGESGLALALLARGHRDVTVVDIAESALDQGRRRAGADAARLRWLRADVTRDDVGTYDLWHDRAVFHFLTTSEERARYRDRVLAALRPSAQVVIATFAEDGPERCSGLPVVRYTSETLAAELGNELELLEVAREVHRTPRGREQPFLYCRFRRVAIRA